MFLMGLGAVDTTGKVVATTTIYPHEPARRWDEALATLGKLAVRQSAREAMTPKKSAGTAIPRPALQEAFKARDSLASINDSGA